jgi:hypothetical protein
MIHPPNSTLNQTRVLRHTTLMNSCLTWPTTLAHLVPKKHSCSYHLSNLLKIQTLSGSRCLSSSENEQNRSMERFVQSERRTPFNSSPIDSRPTTRRAIHTAGLSFTSSSSLLAASSSSFTTMTMASASRQVSQPNESSNLIITSLHRNVDALCEQKYFN